MDWSYEYRAESATHRPTGLVFTITNHKAMLHSPKPESPDDATLATLAKELETLIQDCHLRHRMQTLLHGDYSGDFDLAAHILAQQTKKKVSTRTLQAWLMPFDRPSSRRCPEWAVAALEKHARSTPGLTEHLKGIRAVRLHSDDAQTRQDLHLHDQLNQRLLPAAEHSLRADDQVREKWAQMPLNELPQKIAEFEILTRRKMDYLNDMINALLSTLREDGKLKESLEEHLRRDHAFRHRLEQAKHDISLRQNEFSTDDATLP